MAFEAVRMRVKRLIAHASCVLCCRPTGSAATTICPGKDLFFFVLSSFADPESGVFIPPGSGRIFFRIPDLFDND
jgi:hypothetical protein